eukprot:TRINITY_DN12434_c0_g1_i1.p1 TRINITY_DN12434_c0_g1~~TRINITY_DN12434_c0_g1_i1.p1  ORF type:complete len:630 (+),score=99.49 TRINITY_DN12434_c0_g1_i1:367-2256(+)
MRARWFCEKSYWFIFAACLLSCIIAGLVDLSNAKREKAGSSSASSGSATGPVCGGSSSSSGSSASASASSASGAPRRLAEPRRLASGVPWYCYTWERDYIRASVTVAILLLTLIFEEIHHHILHNAEHAYVFGNTILSPEEKNQKATTQIFGEPLRKVWITHLSGEVMVLGFIAACTWSSNQLGFFYFLASFNHQHLTLPTDPYTYLHLMEELHMQLFLGMVLFYAILFGVVRGTSAAQRRLEDSRQVVIEQVRARIDGREGPPDDVHTAQFKHWREVFLRDGVDQIFEMKRSDPCGFYRIIHNMGFDDEEAADISRDDFRSAVTGCFSFASFAALSMRQLTTELMQFRSSTLMAIISLKSIFSLFHRYAGIHAEHLIPFFMGLCAVSIVALYVATLKSVESCGTITEKEAREYTGIAGLLHKFHTETNSEMIMIRVLQFQLFFLCYHASDFLLGKDKYEMLAAAEGGTIFSVIAFLFTFALILLLLPGALPTFGLVMALPPYFDETNIRTVCTVLEAGGARGGKWAPIVDEKNARMMGVTLPKAVDADEQEEMTKAVTHRLKTAASLARAGVKMKLNRAAAESNEPSTAAALLEYEAIKRQSRQSSRDSARLRGMRQSIVSSEIGDKE